MRKFSRGSRSPKINEQEKGIFLASHWSICFDFFKNFQKNSERKIQKKFANVQPDKLSVQIDQREMCTSCCLQKIGNTQKLYFRKMFHPYRGLKIRAQQSSTVFTQIPNYTKLWHPVESEKRHRSVADSNLGSAINKRNSIISVFRMGSTAIGRGMCDINRVLFRVSKSPVKKLGST